MSTPDPPDPPSPPDPDKPPDPLALLRSRSYIVLLVLAAIIGAPVSAVAYFFLALVSKLQGWVFTDLPKGLGFHAEPLWWPLLPLAAGRGAGRPHPEVPARDRRPLPRRRVQDGRRASQPPSSFPASCSPPSRP